MSTGSGHLAFPADGFRAVWESWDRSRNEELFLRWENEAWTATGRVWAPHAPPEERVDVEYVIRLSPWWHVRQFLLFRDLTEPDLWLGTDGHGRWGEMNGAHRPELDGAHDVALAVTPFTHTLPIRRLALEVGGSMVLPVVSIDVDTLAVEVTTVAYERPANTRWVIAGGSEDETEFEVDSHGVVIDLPGHFRRTA